MLLTIFTKNSLFLKDSFTEFYKSEKNVRFSDSKTAFCGALLVLKIMRLRGKISV